MSNVEDGFLHIAMGLGLALPIAGADHAIEYLDASRWALLPLTGAWIVFLREVTQEQMKRKIETGQPYRFFSDWNPFKFSPGKQVETWIAVVPLMVGSIIAGAYA